jgi:hypothetical protein
MPTPAPTQILDEIGDRLGNISSANGYFYDLIKLDRGRLEPFRNQDMPGINYYTVGDVLSKKMHQGVRERIMSVVIEFYTTTRDRVFLDIANELNSDITIALERKPSLPKVSDMVSASLGGLVVELEMLENTPAIGKGQNPYCGSIYALNITYRVNRYDPFKLIN